MHIGLFGGSFNPPHVGHLIVAERLREEGGFDAVWWVPARVSPHKTSQGLASAADRVAMIRLAIENNPGFDVCTLELDRPAPSFTVDTVRQLRATHPDARFEVLVGADSLRGFPEWRDPAGIVAMADLLVYPRSGEPTGISDPLLAGHVRVVQAPLVDVSGTDIRRRRAAGASIRYLVPEPVRYYIERRGLYA